MCGISGIYNTLENLMQNQKKYEDLLGKMNQVQKNRGPDDEGIHIEKHCGLAQVRLSVIDLVSGHQPIVREEKGDCCSIVYNGEIYNMHELKEKMKKDNIMFYTKSDTEVVLAGYMNYGEDFIKELNGIFAFAIFSRKKQEVLLCRDRLGVKPLFYTKNKEEWIFASEIKGILAYSGVKPTVDREGLCEVLGLGPAKTLGKGVFRGIEEVLPGAIYTLSKDGIRKKSYWKLTSRPHEDSLEETIEKTRELVYDAIRRQLLSDVPICTFLSGGLDSSLVTAISARELHRKGQQLNTFSFDFKNNGLYFKKNSFQPDQDGLWALQMAQFANTNHVCLECSNEQMIESLEDSVKARDLPGMGDIESSMLCFCRQVVGHNKVALTGECADEIFGGYPWFHSQKAFETQNFPWSCDFTVRKSVLQDEVLEKLDLEEYSKQVYLDTIHETPYLEGESQIDRRRREIAYLNLRWFMITLLDRMDRSSMYAGLEARVPLADYRILEYVWNVPWEMKCCGNMVKGLLREVGKPYLPEEIFRRKKSPYPKTYDPAYEALLKYKILECVTDTAAPIRKLVDSKKMEKFCKDSYDYGKPFYGQLMAGPQFLAYLLQINFWLEHYQIDIKF